MRVGRGTDKYGTPAGRVEGLTSEARPCQYVGCGDIINDQRVVKEPEEIEIH